MSVRTLKREYNLKLTMQDILELIKGFTIEDKVLIEKEIEKETLLYRAKQLDNKVKDNPISMEEIVDEVKAVRKSKVNAK
ncbi:MAG: hypothetical protein WCH34_13045 [Bacteroidota bacterium]